MPIRELTHGTQCDLVLLVQVVERRPRKDGRDFLKVVFSDRTGSLQTNVWDDVDEIEALLVVGSPFRVYGKFEIHDKYGPQLKLEGFTPAVDGTYDPTDLRAGPPVPVPELETRLRALIATVQDPGMTAVLAAVLGESTTTWKRYREAPAAKRVHQAYRHGLLEHCLTVAEAVSAAATIFPGVDRDLAVTAALIHDIGKLDAYEFGEGDVVELTDAGKLRGEIVIGYERMHGVLNGIPGISEVRKQAFLHIILAHHGKLEHGSPVTPQTREAFLVHSMDNLGGKLGTVDRMEQERPPGAAWTAPDWAFGGSVWFAESAQEPQDGEAAVGAPWLSHGGLAPQQPPVLHPPEPDPAEHVEAVVPRGAFEDTDAWRPPTPEELSGPPVPSEPFTAPPEHEAPKHEAPTPEASRGAAPEAPRGAAPEAPRGAAPAPGADRPSSAGHAAAPAAEPDLGLDLAIDAEVDAMRVAAREEAFDTPGRPTPERSEDDLATSSAEQRRGGPPPPPDAQPLPF